MNKEKALVVDNIQSLEELISSVKKAPAHLFNIFTGTG